MEAPFWNTKWFSRTYPFDTVARVFACDDFWTRLSVIVPVFQLKPNLKVSSRSCNYPVFQDQPAIVFDLQTLLPKQFSFQELEAVTDSLNLAFILTLLFKSSDLLFCISHLQAFSSSALFFYFTSDYFPTKNLSQIQLSVDSLDTTTVYHFQRLHSDYLEKSQI